MEELLQNSSTNSNGPLKRLPFDPNFFTQQTSLEQNHSKPQQQQQQQHWKPQYIPQEDVSHVVGQSNTASNSQPKIEPIYQEIPAVGRGNHRTQRSWSGSKGNLATTASTQWGVTAEGSHKRTYSGGDLLSVRQSSIEDKKINKSSANSSSTLDRFTRQSLSMRYPLKIDTSQSVNDIESIPNSPSFYTKNPEAATMPESQHNQPQHFFKDHLTNLDSNIPRGHNRVMNWMQQSAFWDPNATNQTLPGIPGPPVQVGVAPIQGSSVVPMGQIDGMPIPMSQSIHSQLSQGGAQRFHSSAILPNQPHNNKFQDHLYEDPDHLKLMIQKNSNMMRSSSMSNPRTRPHHSTQQISSSSTLPYVTRELPCSKSGSSMYATDV